MELKMKSEENSGEENGKYTVSFHSGAKIMLVFDTILVL